MPGILGLVGEKNKSELKSKVSKGLKKLLRRPNHHSKSCSVESFAVGVALRHSNLEGGDLWESPKKDLIIAVDGEIYAGPRPKKSNFGEITHPTHKCAAYIGALFKEYGTKWVQMVQGAFSVVIYDLKKGKIWLFVDRYGLRPLYYSKKNKYFVFGSSMAAITTALSEKKWELNFDAVTDFFTFEHVLGEKSFVLGLELLPNAGIACYDLNNKNLKISTYWSFEEIRPASISFNSAVKNACRLFKNVIDEQISKTGRHGIYLTSGLDSRTIAGYLKKRIKTFPTFTYGIKGCRDMVWGKALAKRVGSKHLSFPLDNGSWVFDYSNEFVSSTESFVNCFHSHGISTFEKARKFMDVHLSGIGGGSFAGGDTTSHEVVMVGSYDECLEKMYKYYRFHLGNVFRSSLEQDNLFKSPLKNKLKKRAESSFVKEFQKYRKLRPDMISDAFTLNNRYKKLFSYLISNERNYFENRCPFMDYRFLDFIFSVPASLRLHRRLQIGMISHSLPQLKWVPWQFSGSPITNKKWLEFGFKGGRKVFEKLLTTINPHYKAPSEPGRNYPKWLFKYGINWAENIMCSDQLKKRGILNESYLLELIERVPSTIKKQPYQEQRNLTYRIGAAVTFELMCRQIFDK